MANSFKTVKASLVCIIVFINSFYNTVCQNISTSSRPTELTSSLLSAVSSLERNKRTVNPVLSKGPSITRIVAITSTALKVTWKKLTKGNRSSKIIQYHICYSIRSSFGLDCALNKTVDGVNATMTVLTGLNKDTTYDVAIKASTAQGYGDLGPVRTGRTLGDVKASHYGKHFVLGFTEQYDQTEGYLQISIIALFNTNVTVTGLTSSSPLFQSYIQAGRVKDYRPPLPFRMNGMNIERKGLEVTSSNEIALICMNHASGTADGYLALPVNVLGVVYVAASYKPIKRADIGIISSNPDTIIRIKFSGTGNLKYKEISYKRGSTFSVTLQKLETFHIIHDKDLSGTIISADKPVSVISGDKCAKFDGSACDHLSAFLLPVQKWGRSYIVSSQHSTGDLFRAFAYENDTIVSSIFGRRKLSSGEFAAVDLEGGNKPKAAYINCSKSCQVVQYVKGRHDPSIIIFPSVDHFLSYYTVVVQSDSVYTDHVITLLIKERYKNGLIMNGVLLKDLTWENIRGTEYAWSRTAVTSNQGILTFFHTLPSVRFGLLVYGGGSRISYGYPGGFSLEDNVTGNRTNILVTTKPTTAPATSKLSINGNRSKYILVTTKPTTASTSSELSTNGKSTYILVNTTAAPISSKLPTKDSCPRETVSTAWGILSWPKTKAGSRATLACPHDSKTSVSRDCNFGLWTSFDASSCPYLNKTSLEILKLSEKPVNSSNVLDVSQQIKNLSFPGENINSDDVTNMASLLENIVAVEGKTDEVANDLFDVIDNILDASLDSIFKSQEETNSSSRILYLFNNLLEKVNLTEKGSFKRTQKNFAVDMSIVDPGTFHGKTFSGIVNQASEPLMNKSIGGDPKTASHSKATSISLPQSIFNHLSSEKRARRQVIIFSLFKETKFFQANNTYHSKFSQKLNSYVISGSIKSLSLSNLRYPVIFKFPKLQNGKENRASCVFWSFSQAKWSSEGCTFKGVQEDGRIICNCDHLTNFAMLMDINIDDESTHEKVLGIISYIGCVVSLIGLILTIITILSFNDSEDFNSEDLRNKVPTQILLNFCIALSITLIVFLSAAERSKTSSMTSCRVAAIALHYLVLVVFMWMATEAVNMYLAFVKVLASYIPRFILKFCIVSWGAPVVVVLITASFAYDNYGDNKYCRLHGLPFLVSLLAPVVIILFGNFIAFVLVFRSLLASGSKVTSDRKVTGYQRARQGCAILVVLGLTWLFGVLAINEAKEVFQYLFCIFNSLQGLLVFVFYCILPTRIREKYRQKLLKKKYRTALSSKSDSRGKDKIGKKYFNQPSGKSINNTIAMNTMSVSSCEVQTSDSLICEVGLVVENEETL